MYCLSATVMLRILPDSIKAKCAMRGCRCTYAAVQVWSGQQIDAEASLARFGFSRDAYKAWLSICLQTSIPCIFASLHAA